MYSFPFCLNDIFAIIRVITGTVNLIFEFHVVLASIVCVCVYIYIIWHHIPLRRPKSSMFIVFEGINTLIRKNGT